MCLIRCNVKIRTTQLSGPGVTEWPGNYRRNHKQKHAQGGYWGETGDAEENPRGIEAGNPVYGVCEHYTEGLRSPGTDDRITKLNHRRHVTTVRIPIMWLYQDREHNTDSDDWARHRQMEDYSPWSWRGATGGTGKNDQRCTVIWRESLSIEDTVS